MSDLAAADAAARERALDPAMSFIVQAPAGSGKTTVLTQRYLRLLTTVDEPEQVLAITFTRKAAGEMRERVQLALDGALTPKTPADVLTLELAAAVRAHAARRGWGLDDSAARLRIQTIDAFNGYLANALPITARSRIGRTIADAPDDLYALAARETLRMAETDPALQADFERILRRLDDRWDTLERLLAQLLPKRAEWLPNLPQLSGAALVPLIEAGLVTLVTGQLTAALAALPRELLEEAARVARVAALHVDPDKLPGVAAWRDTAEPPAARLADLPRWRGLVDLTLTSEGNPRLRLTKSEGLPADDPQARSIRDAWLERISRLTELEVAAFVTLGGLPDPVIPASARAALESLARLLLLAAAELKRLFDAIGECDHTEIAGNARHALTDEGAPTPLAERIGTHLMHLLVDEFQDTSRDQYDLLRALTREWTDGDGHTVFVVGDPMQSIYGFRNAEVGRFATVRDGRLGQLQLQALSLRRNFRSAPGLVEWGNRVFARVFPARDDLLSGAVRHLASVAARTNLAGVPVIYRVDSDEGAEAEEVANQIAALTSGHPGETVAVLAGARGHLRAVRAALARRAVPYVGVKLEPLADVPVVRDLEALARALDSPLDRVAWLAVLRAPFVGLALPDLTAVSEAARDGFILDALIANVAGLTPDGMRRLLRATPVLVAAWREREREPRAHRVERAWLALGGPSACGAGEVTHARRFLAALDEEERKRLRGRESELERVMTRLYAEDDARAGAVSLMTIHGAKGLEFDHVFVVGVGRRGRGDETRLLNWLEIPRTDGGDHLLMAPVRARTEPDAEDDAINGYLAGLHRARARAERTRLAYVALTRARRALHVFIHPNVRDEDGVRRYSAARHTLLESLWTAIAGDVAQLPALGTEAPAEPAPPPQIRQRLAADWRAPAPPAGIALRGTRVPLSVEEEAIEFSWVRQTARRVGTVVHEALERFSRGTLPGVESLAALEPRLASRLEALGVEPGRAAGGARQALAALRATLEDPRGRWLFDPAHAQAHSEYAVSGVRGTEIVNAVIDRTFVADGERWVVDFKTSPHEGGDREAFLDSEAQRYAGQLARYAHLARALGPEKVRAGLYFPLLGAWREVPLD